MAAFSLSGRLRSTVAAVAALFLSAFVPVAHATDGMPVAHATDGVPVAHATDAARTATRTVNGMVSSAVMGMAWTAENNPIPNAHVQLRELTSGKVSAVAITDETGRFTFTNLEGGTYVVELVGANGKVLTVGHAFVIAPGDTVATFVRLGTKVPWFNGFFSNAASAVASTASSQGIAAIAPVQIPNSAPSSVR
jgi:carboxypeptidase family protein